MASAVLRSRGPADGECRLEQLQDAVVFPFVSIFSMVNPIGMAALFLEMTKHYSVDVRHKLAYRVAIYGFLLLVVALFVGPYVLNFFGVSLPDIQIAGGIFVFYTAWGMLTAQPKVSGVEAREAADSADIAFFPLTMPITAGAGSLAVTISLSSKISRSGRSDLMDYGGAIIGIALVFVSTALCYRFADVIFRRIGHAGTNVITRLSAFILLAIGVEIVWGGLKPLILALSAK
jgi:multiple antibiotic resistance protein